MMQKSSDEYIKNGLVLWLDGLNRGGEEGKWYNLVGDEVVTLKGNYSELTNGIYATAASGSFDSPIEVPRASGTIEFVCELTEHSSTGRPIYGVRNAYMGGSIASGAVDGRTAVRYQTHTGSQNGWAWTKVQDQLKFIVSATNSDGILNGVAGEVISMSSWNFPNSGNALILYRGTGNYFIGTLYSVRIYDRKLSVSEMLHNQRIDNKRYNFGLTI